MILRQLLRYGAVGILNMMVGFSVIAAAMAVFGLNDVAANAFGYGIGLCVSYSLNRAWTFEHTAAVGRSLWRFAAVTGLAYGCNLAVVLAVHRRFEGNVYLAQLCGILIYAVLGFLGSKYFAFGARGNLPAPP